MANKENIQKWVDALRSGKYKQTTGTLSLDGSFCCLGVACDISGIGEWDSGVLENETVDYITVDKNGNTQFDDSILPTNISEWLGTATCNPVLDIGDEESCEATELNDTMHYTFDEIADAIERTYLNEDQSN